MTATQRRLQKAAKHWKARVLPLGALMGARENAMREAMDRAGGAVGKTTLKKLLNPRLDPSPEWLPSGATIIAFCRAAEISHDWLLTGSGAMELRHRDSNVSSADLETYVELQLADDPAWRRLTTRYDTGVDGAKVLDFVVETMRMLVRDLEEVETVMDDAQSSLSMACTAPNAPHKAVTRATRNLLFYIAHSRPDVQERAGELLRDWTPNAFGFAVSENSITIDRHGAKRRR